MKIKSINPFAIIVTLLAIWLGVTGRVDWWIIVLIGLSHFEVNINL